MLKKEKRLELKKKVKANHKSQLTNHKITLQKQGLEWPEFLMLSK